MGILIKEKKDPAIEVVCCTGEDIVDFYCLPYFYRKEFNVRKVPVLIIHNDILH